MARPTIVKNEYVKKLETAFNNGANVSEACSYAGISRQVFYNHLKGSVEFFDKMQTAVYSPKLKALKIIMQSINKGDVGTAKWLLEKRYGFIQEDLGKELSEGIVERYTTIDAIKEALNYVRGMHHEGEKPREQIKV